MTLGGRFQRHQHLRIGTMSTIMARNEIMGMPQNGITSMVTV